VSTLEIRKNHGLLFEAYRILVKKYAKNLDDLPELLLVGSLGWRIEPFLSVLARNPQVAQKITIVSGLSDDDLSHAYQNCSMTVYPSFAEGWGLPVAESFSYGKFCLCSNTTSLPEVGGQLAEYLAPDDSAGWAKKLEWYFSNKKALKEKEAKIKKEYREWSWEDFGDQVLAAIANTN
jgi:glycosyltransferase involved in cell wall biosynthesis